MSLSTDTNTNEFNLLMSNNVSEPSMDFSTMMEAGFNMNLNYDLNSNEMLFNDLDSTTFNNFDLEDYKTKQPIKESEEQCDILKEEEQKQEDNPVENTEYKGLDKDSLELMEQKRKFHIESEQKRRAQIREGFQNLNSLLPNFNRNGKAPSKALILKKATHYLASLKNNHLFLFHELERLKMENFNLKQVHFLAMKESSSIIDENNKNLAFY